MISIGPSRTALGAGKYPKINPTETEKRKAMRTISMLNVKVTFKAPAIQIEPLRARSMPKIPLREEWCC
jgi:hypothetical protein